MALGPSERSPLGAVSADPLAAPVKPLTAAIVRLASRYGRYGYRRVGALLRTEVRHVSHKRIERICRREGLNVPDCVEKVRGSPHWSEIVDFDSSLRHFLKPDSPANQNGESRSIAARRNALVATFSTWRNSGLDHA